VNKPVIVIALALIFCIPAPYFACHFYNTDFPVFYRAATIVLDRDAPNTDIYNQDREIASKYEANILEGGGRGSFVYSVAAAYLLSPLGLLPYYAAKTVTVMLNVVAYLVSVAIALHLAGATGRLFFYPLLLSYLWWPFIDNQLNAQVNSLLLLLVALSVLAAVKNRPKVAGVFLGIAALFKLFPLVIAGVLGLKNWRIFAACLAAFGASFLIPGSTLWLSAVNTGFYPLLIALYTPIYSYLSQFGFAWYAFYAAAVTAATAYFAYNNREPDYPLLASFAITAMFLVMPIIEYYHLTLLAFPYAYLLASPYKNFSRWSAPVLIMSAALVYFQQCLWNFPAIAVGLLLLWVTITYHLCRPLGLPKPFEQRSL
jgi:hypothetical protein